MPEGSPGAPNAALRAPVERIYNVVEAANLPNLATDFVNGAVLDVESRHRGLVITEVMWGEDVSLRPSSNSQWIELYNPGDVYTTLDDNPNTRNVNEALTLTFYRAREFGDIPTAGATGTLPAGITDRIGTLNAEGTYWSLVGKGQNGRTGTGEPTVRRGTALVTVPIISMYRLMNAVGGVEKGQIASSWIASNPPSVNFDPAAIGIRVGTPGAAADAIEIPTDTLRTPPEKIASTGTIPKAGRIYISEIMFAGGGVLPQWIEIANGSRTEHVNLSGWTLTIENTTADADVSVGAKAVFTIPDGTQIDPSGQYVTPSTILVVTHQGRNNLDGEMAAGQVVSLWREQRDALILLGITRRGYSLLSDIAFKITLAPPEPIAGTARQTALARAAATDVVGNLGADGATTWALPMREDGARHSIVRQHVQVTKGAAEPADGEMLVSWVLASDISFEQIAHIRASSYYGSPNDVGTPGFRPGGVLPVELSGFRPARKRGTGAVMITWSTQSELNTAGFYIKRSQHRDGQFKVINATMIPGAGTTSEKQFYTYTDTTARPNVVYYYQIEDVSLDGNRQVLTRGIRLKGHVGAAGKAATLWGELKTSRE